MDEVLGNAETSALRQTLVAQMVQKQLIEKSVVVSGITDVSEFALPGLDNIDFPRMDNFTVQKKKEDEKVSAKKITFATDRLPLDQEAVVQWIIPKRSGTQSRIALESAAIANAAAAHALQADVDVIEAMAAGAGDSVTLSGDFGVAEIAEMRKKMRQNWFSTLGLTLAVSEDFEEDLLNDANFLNAEKLGSDAVVREGFLGRALGIDVVVSTEMTTARGARALLYHKQSTVIGFQSGPDYEEESALEHLGRRYSLDQLYGYKVLNSGKGIVKLV